jgi:hypothetical protein
MNAREPVLLWAPEGGQGRAGRACAQEEERKCFEHGESYFSFVARYHDNRRTLDKDKHTSGALDRAPKSPRRVRRAPLMA